MFEFRKLLTFLWEEKQLNESGLKKKYGIPGLQQLKMDQHSTQTIERAQGQGK